MLAQRILSFVDSFIITNPGVDKNDLINFLDDVVADVIARGQAVDFDKDAPFVFWLCKQSSLSSLPRDN